ncbi:hypothetical protein LBMAG53_12920 [Planctomycetota bacterium]|nr:hypothetical protein LBMAG53_12920 [Planctomycetota bacterium]
MLSLLAFVPAGEHPGRSAIEAALSAVPAASLDGRDGDDYRPGRWHDGATGGRCLIDLGEPPLERDDLHPPRGYAGWEPAGLAFHLPLTGPHWLMVESLAMIEGVLRALPGLAVIDTEDSDVAGPGSWSRPRVIASWNRQQEAFLLGRPHQPRLGRGDSLRMWRYRRERAAGAAARPDLFWPELLVLGQAVAGGGMDVHPAAVWPDPSRALALPPVQLVVIPGDPPRIVDASVLASSAAALDHGLAVMVGAGSSPPQVQIPGLKVLGDDDWSD